MIDQDTSEITSSPPVHRWVDRGTHYEHLAKQQTKAWLAAKNGRLTASNFAASVGHSRFTTPDQLRDRMVRTAQGEEISILNDLELTPDQIEELKANLERGNIHEEMIREYCRRIFQREFRNPGLFVSKQDTQLGCSYDVEYLDNPEWMMEIKSTKKVSEQLFVRSWTHTREQFVADGIKVCMLKPFETTWNKEKNEHYLPWYIYLEHYDQMQGSMIIGNRKWCNYSVFSEGCLYMEPVEVNKVYWENELLPGIQKFQQTLPIMSRLEPNI